MTMQSIVQRRMGRIIHGKLEDGILYTEAFVRRVLARVRAVFTAITKYFMHMESINM